MGSTWNWARMCTPWWKQPLSGGGRQLGRWLSCSFVFLLLNVRPRLEGQRAGVRAQAECRWLQQNRLERLPVVLPWARPCPGSQRIEHCQPGWDLHRPGVPISPLVFVILGNPSQVAFWGWQVCFLLYPFLFIYLFLPWSGEVGKFKASNLNLDALAVWSLLWIKLRRPWTWIRWKIASLMFSNL